MKLNTLLKTATILACLICSCNNLKHQEQLNIEAEYEHLKLEHELLKSELSDMVERQNSIAKIKESYIKAAKAKNKHIKQDELDSALKFEGVFDELVLGIDYVTEKADYYAPSMGEVVIGLSNWGRSNRESLIKLKVIVYEALSYQDESYIPLYKEAMGELINEY